MGLFSKKKPAASGGNVPPQQFYTLCVKDYHDRAKQLGQAKRDVIFIPELLAFGQRAVLWFYQNDAIQEQIPNPGEYYFVAICTAIECGILFGLKWHLDFEGLKQPGYVESVMEQGPSRLSAEVIRKDLGMNEESFSSFCVQILKRWQAMHEPYWQLRDARDYTFSSTLAAFQLGVSMILSKYGF